jgi:transketolase
MTDYAKIAKEIRLTVLEMLYKAQTSHIGSNFSCVDILTVLYENKKEEDEIIISKGWVAATVYALLARRGTIPRESLETYCQPDSPYIGLLEPTVKGVKCAGGSMGYGLPFGVGFSLAKRIKGEKGKVYVLMSDGEQAIGTTYESALIASHHHLDNLVVIVDNNGFQAMGKVADVLGIVPLQEKWLTFGWDSRIIDGHHYGQIETAVYQLGHKNPHCIIANTIKGKGVSFMENENKWHYLNIDKESYERAKAELQS